ncbi:MAG: UvrD-helicase domain-containing protein, partial [Thermoanaerobaculia bacterium]
MSIDFEKLLNPEQVQAVTHRGGPQLVLAGAGTGKTRVITYRVAWLIQERRIDPYTITAVTFTNKAAAEMKERIEDLLETRPLASFVGTFHRCALRLLRIYGERIQLDKNFAIFDSSDQLSLVKKALKAEKLDDKSFRPRSVLAAISGAKNRLLGPREFERQADDFFSRKVAPVYRRYQRLLRQSSAVDFDDMIGMTVALLENHQDIRAKVRRRSRFLLIDEFQDTNHAQLRLIHQLGGGDGNLTAVGDEDQGIYRWRGAELDNILKFERTFPGAEVYKLERNYRSTQNILDAAGAMVANNEGRRGKSLWTEAGEGDKVALYRGHDERDEARWVTHLLRAFEGKYRLGDMAVLVRTNAQTRSFEEELLRQGMPYLLVGAVRFYERAEIKDVVAYLRFLRNPRDGASLGRILNQPPRGIGKTTRDQAQGLADKAGRSLWEALAEVDLSAIPARGVKALKRFHDTMAPLVEEAPELPLPTLLERLLEATA